MTERTRINVSDYDGRLLGWFVLESAERFLEDTKYVNDFDKVSVNTLSETTHQTLYRTAKGQWVLNDWSDHSDSADDYRFISEGEAKNWLVLNGEDGAVERYFGELEEESGPNLGGRPSIGPKVETRLPQDVLATVDALAKSRSMSRADLLRQLVERGLTS
ncbi:CopG family transcriptional regulator [Streptomyces sp. NPDC051840]|uniref:ribbon-helix-helix domain-containing protein n=1 Tax=Streptomyces sp. NPDC051840 TaxID=3154752 RepID=UPI00342ABF09